MHNHDLQSIAQKAIEHVLRYHDSCYKGLSDPHKAVIKDRIEVLLPLKSLAVDPDVANIEIVADAAMSFLDVYNLEHEDKPLGERFLYDGVQTFASIDLKPALVQGSVSRLQVTSTNKGARGDDAGAESINVSQPGEAKDPVGDDAEAIDPELPATPVANDTATAHTDEVSPAHNVPSPAETPRSRKRKSSGPLLAKAKDPWEDEEIKKLIKWKCQGKTHKEAGVRLGRSEPACAIRHSIVLKQPKWMEFAKVYREKRAAGEDSGAEDEVGVSGEAAEAAEAEEAEEDTNTEKSNNAEQITYVREAK